MTRKELDVLCRKLDRLRRKLMTLEGDDPDDKKQYYLYPPAEPAAIESAEKKAGHAYPPSFKTFLTLHNGWLACWPDWTLLGIPASDNRAAYSDVARTIKQLPVVAKKSRLKSLADEEKRDKKVILITSHAVLGTDFNGGLLLADTNRVNKAGEHELAWVEDGMVVQRRWPTFEAFLNEAITDTERDIAALRKKPATTASTDDTDDDQFDAVLRQLNRQLAAKRERLSKSAAGKKS